VFYGLDHRRFWAFIQVLVFIIYSLATKQSLLPPIVHQVGLGAQDFGDLPRVQQSLGAEPEGPASQMVIASEHQNRPTGEGLVVEGATPAAPIEFGGDLRVGQGIRRRSDKLPSSAQINSPSRLKHGAVLFLSK